MDKAAIKVLVFKEVATIAGVSVEDINDDTSLESLGLDSADAVVLAMALEEATNKEIEVGLFLRCATIAEAAEELAGTAERDAATG